eukprot:6188449-Pleurochrysis_carterae.AAC.2
MEPRMLQIILGRPPDGLWAKYYVPFRRGHIVMPLIMETFDGMAGHACLLLRRLALLCDARFLPMTLSRLLHRQLHRLRPTTLNYGSAQQEPQRPSVATHTP